ncbi:MAG: acyltransferase [Gemmatimonadales bacterium]
MIPTRLGMYERFLNTLIVISARLGLRSRLLHRMRYGAAARGLRLGRRSYVLCRELRAKGPVSIGRNVQISADTVELGRHVVLADGVEVHARRVVIGDNVAIDHSTRMTGGQLESSAIEIGSGVWIFENCYLNTTAGLSIGDGTGIGGYCMIWTHGNWQSYVDGYPTKYEATRLGKNVWLPWHVIVMPGVTIGDNVTTSAGSVIVKDVPSNSLCVGVPAKVIPTPWPPPLTAEETEARIHEIVARFGEWVGGVFAWKDLTLKAAGTPRPLVRSEPGLLEFGGADGRQVRIVARAPSGPGESPAASADLYFTNDHVDPATPGNWVSCHDRLYRLDARDPIFVRFVSFVTLYGIRANDVRSGLINHMGV